MLTQKEKKEIRNKVKSNQHEVFVISIEEMEAIINSSQKGKMEHIQNAWKKIKDKAELGASYYASADDLRTLTKLIGDLGGFATKAYVKNYGGKPHIILKGHPGLRKILTGTKYGIKNPKVITMGLGKSGAISAAKSGGILSIVLLSVYRVADYLLTDESTLTQLIGTLATDVVKVGIATGASIVAASALVGMGVTLAIGPIAAVVIVGVGVSMALSALDNHYGITEKVIKALDEVSDGISYKIANAREKLVNEASGAADSIIDYVVESVQKLVINEARHQLDKFLSVNPQVF